MSQDLLQLAQTDTPADTGKMGERELAHVSFLGAAQEHQKVPEITVPGRTGQPERRGALSYLFARALRGEADADGNGVLRRDELWRFVRENVRMNSEARQNPNLLPNTRGGEIVLALKPGAGASGTAEPVGAAEHSYRLRLAVRPANPQIVEQVRDAVPDIEIAADENDSVDLIWDAVRREVVSAMGDVIAHAVGAAELRGVVEKWEAVRAIRALSARASLRLRIHPDDGVHRGGSRIGLRIEGREHARLTVFSLSGSGTVHYLYPLPRDPAEIPVGEVFDVNDIEVVEPYGAEPVVAVSAATSLDSLNAALSRLHCDKRRAPCRPAARQAADLLAEAAGRARGWSSGILGLYTAPRGG